MTPPRERSAAERARDGRLAWILVGCCAMLTITLLIAAGVALRGPVARAASSVGAPDATGPEVTVAALSSPARQRVEAEHSRAPRQDQVRRGASPPAGPSVGPVIQKRSAERDDEAAKASGDDGDAEGRGDRGRGNREQQPDETPGRLRT